jgi:PKD repeat protein
MKVKHNFITVMLLALYFYGNASTISVSNAQTVAVNFYKLTYNTGHTAITAALNYTKTETDGTVDFYVFNITPGHAFVIVAAQSNVSPILGYSAESSFSSSNIQGIGLVNWMQHTANQVHVMVLNNISADPRTPTLWSAYQVGTNPGSLKGTGVGPLTTTTWNQDPYYNQYCPYDATNGGTSVTGCVATAMAQIMKYWAYPPQGKGSYTYTDDIANGDTYNIGTLSANFGTTTYPWASMPLNLTGYNVFVDTLMYQCGVAVAMDYSALESSSYAWYPGTHACAFNAFKWYFGYDSLSIQNVEESQYPLANWTALIENELNESRVVLYSGTDTLNPAEGGHCWVCDGYDVNNNLHMNWGWGGYDNGYFAIPNLDPASTGYNFSGEESAVIGIQPPTSPVAAMAITSTFACSGSFQFADQSTGAPTSWLWNFGDGTTSTLQNPTHIYGANGTYTVSLKATNVYGTNTVTNTNYVTVSGKAAGPTAPNVTQCSAGTFSLSASTTNPVFWYDSNSNLLSMSNPFTTPSLTKTTTYWVDDWVYNSSLTNTQSLGALSDNIGNGTLYANASPTLTLKFSVVMPVVLQTVTVYSGVAGSNAVQYANAGGTVLASQAVTLVVGINVLTLNWTLPAGGPYYMSLTNITNIYFTIGNTAFPYNDGYGLISITGSDYIDNYGSAYSTYYPYFYDWVVNEPYCVSAKTPVSAIILSGDTTLGGAGTWTWTGTTNTDWFTPCNWDQGSLPGPTSDVVIPGSTTNQPTISGRTGYCNTLTVNTANGGLLTIATSSSGLLSVAQ